jgi:hypothetical protein
LGRRKDREIYAAERKLQAEDQDARFVDALSLDHNRIHFGTDGFPISGFPGGFIVEAAHGPQVDTQGFQAIRNRRRSLHLSHTDFLVDFRTSFCVSQFSSPRTSIISTVTGQFKTSHPEARDSYQFIRRLQP